MQQQIFSECNNLALCPLQTAHRPFCARAGQPKPRDARRLSTNSIKSQPSARQASETVLDSSSKIVLARRGVLAAVAAATALPALLPQASAADEGELSNRIIELPKRFHSNHHWHHLRSACCWPCIPLATCATCVQCHQLFAWLVKNVSACQSHS